MNRSLRSTLSTLTYYAKRLMPDDREGLRILMYHRVTDAHPGKRLCVPVAQFAEHMRWLHEQGYRTITFVRAVELVKGQETGGAGRGKTRRDRAAIPRLSPAASRPKLIALTFDDGFEDNFLYAAPAMERYGFVGTFFVPSAFIAGGPNGHPRADRPMTWQQLKELAARGHEIGGHSVSHAKLSRIPDDRVAYEVRRCKEDLESRLGQSVHTFCYPSGDCNRRVRNIVQANGYVGACTVEPGANHPSADPFVLTRTEISAFDSLWDFEKKLTGAYDWLHRMWQLTR